MSGLLKNKFAIFAVLVFVLTAVYFTYRFIDDNGDTPITTKVERGTVQKIVFVSGKAETAQKANLGFPVSGTVSEILVEVGDSVEKDAKLASLKIDALEAERAEITASLNQLLNGPTEAARNETEENTELKRTVLENTIQEQNKAVENAYRTLMTEGLELKSVDPKESSDAPTLSGTYLCDKSGTYTISVYNSNTLSGYSYSLSGLEEGSYSAYTRKPSPIGECGLQIQFAENQSYSRSVWEIQIPNKNAASYNKNKNNYELAKTQASSSIQLARQDLALARANATNITAPARQEEVDEARARLSKVEAAINDNLLRAPFSGTITNINIEIGESVAADPVITLLNNSAFNVNALIPEIDINQTYAGQTVQMTFDARPEEVLTGTVNFVSTEATTIDGVSYYETIIKPDTAPEWLRNGLNADIDIITEQKEDVLRIPNRFIIKNGNSHQVIRQTNQGTATTSVELLMSGNDGFVAIQGLNEGDTLIAP